MDKTASKIHVLEQSVIEKIAAGEVIERPASVVKEFVENSIDAGATYIDIIIEDAGFSCIRVSDNGSGMGAEDIKKCLLRHATSKISSAEDLYAIATMGFRGEALASIAAVSKLTITSSTTADGLGFSLSCAGGELSLPVPATHTQGTTVCCSDLFYNVPARKKFMKTRKAERMAILNILDQIVVAFPQIHFTCSAEGRRVFDLPASVGFQERIAQVAGLEFAKKLVRCSHEKHDMSAVILISEPSDASARPHFQNLYVNLRRIDNDSVLWAVREAFSRFITSSLKPSWFCFLTVDPSKIDVNIHPTKQKIKFEDEKALFSFIFGTIHSTLRSHLSINPEETVRNESEKSAAGLFREQGFHGYDSARRHAPAQGQNPGITEQKPGPTEVISAVKTTGESQQLALSFLSILDEKEAKEKLVETRNAVAGELAEGTPWSLIQCFQINKMFILAPIKNGILIIDQHAAHERILYEEALEDIRRGKGESQRLLFPVVFEMTTAHKEVVLSCRDYFSMLGFDVQDFGGHTLAISAMPATGFMKSTFIEEAIREIVTNLMEEKDRTILADPQRRFAASFACGAAIKFGQELKQEEMNILLNTLFAAKDPYICPHGRPTLIRISIDELLRRFLR